MNSFEESFDKWQPHFYQYRRLLKYRHKTRRPRKLFARVEKFWSFLRKEEILPDLLQPCHLQAYVQALRSGALCIQVERYSSSSVDSYLRAAKAWSRYLYQNGFIFQEPLIELAGLSPKKQIQSSLSKAQVRQILHLPDLSKPWGLRNRAILEVLYGSGLRISEAASLTLQSVELEERLLHLKNTKNGWDRSVPITRSAAASLARYLREGRHKMQGPRTGTSLWLTFHRRVLQTETFTDLAVDYSALLDFNFTMHGLRHACATHLLEEGASLRHIAELLGHTALESTGYYAKARLLELQKVHKRFHPRG